MKFLSKDREVRNHILARLPNEDPFHIARTIHVREDVDINLLDDSKDLFKTNLDRLLGPGSGTKYESEDSKLKNRNKDTDGNLQAFVSWWEIRKDAYVVDRMREVIRSVLEKNSEIDVEWQYDLPDDGPHKLDVSADIDPPPPKPLLIFHTQPDAVEPGEDLPARA